MGVEFYYLNVTKRTQGSFSKTVNVPQMQEANVMSDPKVSLFQRKKRAQGPLPWAPNHQGYAADQAKCALWILNSN